MSKTLERICPSDFFENLSRNRFLLEGFVALLCFFALGASGEHLGNPWGSLGKLGRLWGAKMAQDRRFPRGSRIQVELQSEILEEIRRPKVRKIERFGTCIADFLEDLGSKKS